MRGGGRQRWQTANQSANIHYKRTSLPQVRKIKTTIIIREQKIARVVSGSIELCKNIKKKKTK